MARRASAIFTTAIFLTLAFPLSVHVHASSPGGELQPPYGLCAVERTQDAGVRVALTWEPVEAAFGYNVYRSDTAGGPFSHIGGKAADSMLDYPFFLDDTAETGRGYYYAVTSVDVDLNESPFSAEAYATPRSSVRAAGGMRSMTCSLSDQRIYFFEGGQLVNIMRCSTGRNNRTPSGNFSILNHYRVHGGIGGSVLDYWMSFTSSHGMHAWPRGMAGYETGLGTPLSAGCIRLHPLEAYWPYEWAPNGTPLTVTYASMARRVIWGCHSSIGSPELSPVWYFAEGYTAEGYDTYLLLSNPGGSPVEAKVSFLKENGEVVEQACAFGPRSRFTLAVDDVPGMDAAAFSIEVVASGPIVAERAMYFAAGRKTDGTVSLGAVQPSPDWYFAEGHTAEGFETYLLLANPGEDAVNAWVYFFLEGGGVVDYVFQVGPRSRFTMPVNAFPVVGSASFSMQVHADGPIVAERAMYFNKGTIQGGHAALGAEEPSLAWYFAEGCTRRFFQSYILLGNPGEEDAFVCIDFYLNEGSIRHEYLIRARSRVTVPIASQGGLSDTEMAFSVYSDHPVVVERSVYYERDSRRGGHATMGSPRSSHEWYFAEGYTESAFDTYVLLSNPSFETAWVEMVFQRDDGAVFTKVYSVPAQRRVTVNAGELPGLERASFSIVVRSDVPVMAERAMYFTMTRGY